MVVQVIQTVTGLILGGILGFIASALSWYFPDEKNLKGSFAKAKKNKKITALSVIFSALLSGVAAFFTEWLIMAVICVFLTAALIIIFTVDFRTYEIPFKVNIFIFSLGIVRMLLSLSDVWLFVIGFFAISVPFAIIYYVSKGRAIGFGDVKMMAAAGLLIGWKNAILATFIGCIVGSVTHLIRMKKSGEGAVLAMGPYLAIGVYIAAVWGERIVNAYISLIRI